MKVAITGGIGSGKSYVCQELSRRGINIYNCDAAAKRLMLSSAPLQQSLEALIGKPLFIDGHIDKAAISTFIMDAPENVDAVNAIVHPTVAQDFLNSGLQWMECAILFESGIDRLVDVVICVTAPRETRIRRIMQRDNISRTKALQWMSRQLPQRQLIARSQFRIINDGKADIPEQVTQLLKQIQN